MDIKIFTIKLRKSGHLSFWLKLSVVLNLNYFLVKLGVTGIIKKLCTLTYFLTTKYLFFGGSEEVKFCVKNKERELGCDIEG